jgi:ketosteroid isomerase-like protein
MQRRHLLLAPPLAAAAQNTPAAQRIRAILTAQQEAWNRGDLNAFMAAYWNSPELTFIGKSIARGWQGTMDRYRREYGSRAKMGTLTFSDLEIHEVGADAAWVFGRYALQRTAEGGGDASGKYTLVLQRIAGDWKIVLDHTST